MVPPFGTSVASPVAFNREIKCVNCPFLKLNPDELELIDIYDNTNQTGFLTSLADLGLVCLGDAAAC